MNPELDIFLKYVELKRAEQFLRDHYEFDSDTKEKLFSQINHELSLAEHLIKNPWNIPTNKKGCCCD